MTTANLAIDDNDTVIQYVSLGEAIFIYDFPIVDEAELKASIDMADQVLGADFTITGVGDEGGGTVVFGVATTPGEIITFWQDLDFKRATGFPTGAAVLAGEALNTEFVRQVRHDQQLARDIARALRLPIDDTVNSVDMELVRADLRKGKFLRFSDGSGAPEMSEILIAGTVISQSVLGGFLWPQSDGNVGVGDELGAGIDPPNKHIYYGLSGRYGDIGVGDATAVLQDMYDADCGYVVYERPVVNIAGVVTITTDVKVFGNGCHVSGDGRHVYQGSSVDADTNLTVAATKGDQTITVASVAGLAVDGQIRLRNPADNSFSPFDASHRDGEMVVIASIAGLNVTLVTKLESSYPITTTLLDVFSPVVPFIENITFETNEGATSQPLSLKKCSNGRLSNVKCIGGSLRAIEVEACFNMEGTVQGVCRAPAAGLQYGISISQSQNCHFRGGPFYGTRHACTMGTSGEMPTRHCSVTDFEASNEGDRSGSLDFHSSVADSYYERFVAHGNTKLAGQNNEMRYGKVIASADNDNVLGYLEPNGGVLAYRHVTVESNPASTHPQLIGDISSAQSLLQDKDTLLIFEGELELNSNQTRIGSHTQAQSGTVDLSIEYKVLLRGNVSGLANLIALTIDTAGNPGGHATPPGPPKLIALDVKGEQSVSSVNPVSLSGNVADTTEFVISHWPGTATPAYETDGVHFDSVTYDPDTTMNFRRFRDMVQIWGTIATDSITVGLATGNVVLAGLPFDVANTSQRGGLIVGSVSGWPANVSPIEIIPRPNTREAFIRRRSDVNDISTAYAPGDLGVAANNNRLYFSGSYLTDESI